MSEKKEKSKSKSKGKEKVEKAEKAEKPPKDVKSKKSKDDKGDSKSKKSVDKTEKVSKKKKDEKSQKPQPANPDLDLSQDNFSDFLKNPFSFPPTITTDDALCPHHKEPNTLFCEICEQTGCESCIVYGPHNNQMHRITRIDEAFQARYLYLNEIVCGPLLQKRDKLNKYLEELTLLSDELRYYKNGIEKLTKVEFNEMLERLKTSAGSKFAVLHHEMADLQRDLEGINTLGNEFFELTNLNPILPNNSEPAPKAIVPFLLRSRYLQEEAENLIAKPIKTSVEIYPYDLPRELTERKLILQRNRNWIELLKLKDEAIWTLNQQKKGLRGKIMDSLNEQAQAQITQWGRLKDQIKNELQQLTLYCQKCRCESNEQTVNEECSKGGYHNFRH